MKTLAMVLMVLAGEAAALSCVRPDVVSSFQRAEEVPEDVYLLKGTLRFDPSLLPEGVINEERNPPPIPARFEGQALNRNGFTTPYARSVTLQPLCFGPWCGSAQPGQEAIMFATVRGADLVIAASPCGGQIFYEPTRQMEQQLIACMNGGC